MIIDNSAVFSDGQAITASAVSTNTIDLGKKPRPFGWVSDFQRDKGEGHPIPIAVQVTQDFNNLTTLTVQLQMADDEAFTSPVVVAATGAIPVADLKSGKKAWGLSRLPLGITGRYLRLNYVVAGTAPTTGKIFAGVVFDVPTNNH